MNNLGKHLEVINFIREIFKIPSGVIPLHEPRFNDLDKKYLLECIDSTFVSSVGAFISQFEELLKDFTSAKEAIGVVNGTAALHVALLAVGVGKTDEVLTQSLTFVATANAIKYCGAEPIFIDSAKDNLGMCALSLKKFLEEECEVKSGRCINRKTGKVVKACVPMHVFGNFVDIQKIVEICREFNIKIVEDAAESLGSWLDGQHAGLFGDVGILSFNGNKIITCGGGGAVITNNSELAKRIRHLSTTAKVGHPWEYFHNEVGYNYRLPNLNAALACSQMKFLDTAISAKKNLALKYENFAKENGFLKLALRKNEKPNNWLNYFLLESLEERNQFLELCHKDKVFVRPVWALLNKLPPFKGNQSTTMENAEFFEQRVVCLPSSVIVS